MLATFAVIAVLLGAAALLSRLASEAGLPAPAATVLVGVAAAGMLPHALHIALTPAILALFLPALIFEAAWASDAHMLRGAAVAIGVLAVPGVVLTALAIAGGAAFASGFALPAALALGTILSATDPVAVLALFRKLNVPVHLLTIVEGESIAHDGVAVVLLQAVTPLAGPGIPAPIGVLGHMAYVSGAGVLVGIVIATVARTILHADVRPWGKIAVTLVVAYGSYGAASFLGASGILASAAAGIALPALARSEQLTIERFWDRTAGFANAVVFLLTGLSVQFARIFNEPLLLGVTLAAVLASRGLLAYALVPLCGPTTERRAWRHAIALAGLRGGLSLALALGLPAEFPNRAQIIDAVFAVVFLTIVVQSWALAPLIRRLHLQNAGS